MGHHAKLKSVPQNINGHAMAHVAKTDKANPRKFGRRRCPSGTGVWRRDLTIDQFMPLFRIVIVAA
jgi:hypothetical protein